MNEKRKIEIDEQFCFSCGEIIKKEAELCIKCGVRHKSIPISITISSKRVTAGLLAIFLGGLGIHKFYMQKVGIALLYLIFSLTLIPIIIGFVEGIIYLSMDDESFYKILQPSIIS